MFHLSCDKFCNFSTMIICKTRLTLFQTLQSSSPHQVPLNIFLVLLRDTHSTSFTMSAVIPVRYFVVCWCPIHLVVGFILNFELVNTRYHEGLSVTSVQSLLENWSPSDRVTNSSSCLRVTTPLRGSRAGPSLEEFQRILKIFFDLCWSVEWEVLRLISWWSGQEWVVSSLHGQQTINLL